jgi:positive phototaxis protein PixI
LSLVRDSQSSTVAPQGERLGIQLLRFRLRLDRSVRAAGTDKTELAMIIDRSGSSTEMTTARARQGATELIDIPIERVVPIPHLPLAVLGVYNWRGEVLWVVDLAVLLGVNEQQLDPDRRIAPTIVVKSLDPSGETKTLGLVVDEIADIEWCELATCPPATLTPDRVDRSHWVKGYAIAPNGTALTILDELAIVDRAELHADI